MDELDVLLRRIRSQTAQARAFDDLRTTDVASDLLDSIRATEQTLPEITTRSLRPMRLIAVAAAIAIVLLAVQAILPEHKGGVARVLAAGAVDGNQVFTYMSDGTADVYTLPGEPLDVAVSPTGNSVAYAGAISGPQADIFVASIDGSRASLVAGGQQVDRFPVWSPDGRTLAFLRMVDATTTKSGGIACGPCRSEVVVVDAAATTSQRVLTSEGNVLSISWAPDGHHIAVVVADGLGRHIDIIDVADGSTRRLLRCVELCAEPAWSPDGRRLAFIVGGETDAGAVRMNLQVGLAGIDQSGYSIVTDDDLVRRDIAWLPNSTTLITVASQQGESATSLYSLDVDTGTQLRLTNSADSDSDLAISRDGEILFVRTTPSDSHMTGSLQVLEPDGGTHQIIDGL